MNKTDKNKVIVCLRVLALCFVLLQHGEYHFPMPDNVPLLATIFANSPSWAGVWIFFFISGFTLGQGFFIGRYDLKDISGKFSLKKFLNFYLLRFLRIAPDYYLYLLISVPIINHGKLNRQSVITLVRLLTFTYNESYSPINGVQHLWYVSTVMQLYLLIPLLYYAFSYLKKKFKHRALFYILIVSLIGAIIRQLSLLISHNNWYVYDYTFFATNIDIVLLGIIANSIDNEKSWNFLKTRACKVVMATLFVILIGFNYYINITDNLFLEAICQDYFPTLYVFFCIYFVAYVKLNKIHFERIISFINRHSYSFYLVHFSGIILAQKIALITPFNAEVKNIIYYIIGTALSFVFAMPLTYIGNSITKKVHPYIS